MKKMYIKRTKRRRTKRRRTYRSRTNRRRTNRRRTNRRRTTNRTNRRRTTNRTNRRRNNRRQKGGGVLFDTSFSVGYQSGKPDPNGQLRGIRIADPDHPTEMIPYEDEEGKPYVLTAGGYRVLMNLNQYGRWKRRKVEQVLRVSGINMRKLKAYIKSQPRMTESLEHSTDAEQMLQSILDLEERWAKYTYYRDFIQMKYAASDSSKQQVKELAENVHNVEQGKLEQVTQQDDVILLISYIEEDPHLIENADKVLKKVNEDGEWWKREAPPVVPQQALEDVASVDIPDPIAEVDAEDLPDPIAEVEAPAVENFNAETNTFIDNLTQREDLGLPDREKVLDAISQIERENQDNVRNGAEKSTVIGILRRMHDVENAIQGGVDPPRDVRGRGLFRLIKEGYKG